ncbi:Globoside alpha-1,3-N-acetylgalactosaminyltransferase 1 [Quaeritorhiza haematococci]|nr:Globoside alpha-1,3-N-acetylgalactosaminyltransferase 1 [Quaeritorhiza haematococci]
MTDWSYKLESLTKTWEQKLNGTRVYPEEYLEMLFLKDPRRFMQLPCAWNTDLRNVYRPVAAYSCRNAPKAYVVSDWIDPVSLSSEKQSFFRAIARGYANMNFRGIRAGILLFTDDGTRMTEKEKSKETLMSIDMARCRGPREMDRLAGRVVGEPSMVVVSAVLSEDDVRFLPHFVSAVQRKLCNQQQVKRTFVIFRRDDLELPDGMQNTKFHTILFPMATSSNSSALHQLFQFLTVSGKLLEIERSFDHVLWMDMKSIIVEPICFELLGESIAVKHSQFFDPLTQDWPYEPNITSAAFVAPNSKLLHPAYAPTIYSGCGPNFAHFVRHVLKTMSLDVVDHDILGVPFESYFQHYLISNPPFRTLSPAYHYAISSQNMTPAVLNMTRLNPYIVYSGEYETLKNFTRDLDPAGYDDLIIDMVSWNHIPHSSLV